MASYDSVRQVLNKVYDSTNGLLKTSATISGDVNVDSTSTSTSGIIGKASGTNADFTTAYASGTTITCSSLPTGVSSITAADIVSLLQISSAGSVTNTYTRDDVTITASGTDPTTLTVTGATFSATDTFIVYTNIPQTRGDKVDLIEIAGTSTNVNGGNRDTGTQTVTLADDDPSVTALQIIDDWDATEDSAIGTDGSVVMFEAVDADKTSVANGDAVIPVATLEGKTITAGYTFSTESNRTEEIDPISQHYVNETLANITDGADDTYYYYVDMNGYTGLNIQGELSGGSGTVTSTVEGSWQDDGTAPASCAYQDITQYGFSDVLDGTSNASYTADFVLSKSSNVKPKYVRVKIVASTGDADDADWTLFSTKWY